MNIAMLIVHVLLSIMSMILVIMNFHAGNKGSAAIWGIVFVLWVLCVLIDFANL